MSKIITFKRDPGMHLDNCWRRHVRVTVNVHDQIVECQECGLTLNPFKVLLDWAQNQWTVEYRYLKEAEDLEKIKAACETLLAEIRSGVQGATHHHTRRLETLTKRYAGVVGFKKLEDPEKTG